MRKRFVFLTFAALTVLALFVAACGDDDDDSGGAATATHTAAAGTATKTTAAGTATTGATPTEAGGGGSPEAKAITITATDFQFDMTAITAQEGQPINITLENDGSAEHSFTVGDVDVTEAEGGESGQGGFTASGDTIEFHCKYHPSQMKGTITIS